MKLTIEMNRGNAAYEEDMDGQTADAVDEIARKVRDGYQGDTIYDFNGNRVGGWTLNTEDE